MTIHMSMYRNRSNITLTDLIIMFHVKQQTMTKAAYPILHLLSLDDENDAMTRLLSCHYTGYGWPFQGGCFWLLSKQFRNFSPTVYNLESILELTSKGPLLDPPHSGLSSLLVSYFQLLPLANALPGRLFDYSPFCCLILKVS